MLRRYAAEIGMPGIVPHDLRLGSSDPGSHQVFVLGQ
jgi:hypothetical protein